MTTWTRGPDDPYGRRLTGDIGGHTLTRELNTVAEIDCPFRVSAPDADGRVLVDDAPLGFDAPEVSDDPGARAQRLPHDVRIDDERWRALTGRSGQYGYHGAQLHPSEVLAGGLARDVLAEPGVYVVVEVRDDSGEYPDADPIGWAILRYREV